MTARRGPRGGSADTRGEIVEAARAEFATKGYEATSVRGVARSAGVDPALVHHYFAGKRGLFAEVVGLGFDPGPHIAAVVAGPVEGVGERLARTFFEVWDSPEGRVRLLGIFRSVATHDEASRMIREFVLAEVFGRVAVEVAALTGRAPAQARRGASLAASQMVGLGLLRYVVEAPEVVDAPVEELVAALAPTLQRYLVGQ